MASTSNLSTDITALIVEYYEKKSLEEAQFENGLLKRGQKGTIPDGNSKVIHWHRWDKFPLASDLSEGAEPGNGESASVTEIKAALVEFGSYIQISLFGDAVRLDKLIKESYNKFSEQTQRTANRRTMTSLVSGDVTGSNSFSALAALYAGGASGIGTTTTPVTSKDITKAVARIEQNQGPRGIYMTLDPWTKIGLMMDAEFRDLIKHTEIDILKRDNLPLWGGAMLDRQDEPWREDSAAGAIGTYLATGDLITTFIYSEQAYGVAQLMGQGGLKPKFHVQNISVTGANMTIGYRIPFKAAVLNANWGIQLRGKVADASVSSVA